MQSARACPLRSERCARTSITAGVSRVTAVEASKALGWSVAVVGTVTASSEVQPSKAYLPMCVTECGIVTERAVQLSKAHTPMVVTESGIVTEAREVQS